MAGGARADGPSLTWGDAGRVGAAPEGRPVPARPSPCGRAWATARNGGQRPVASHRPNWPTVCCGSDRRHPRPAAGPRVPVPGPSVVGGPAGGRAAAGWRLGGRRSGGGWAGEIVGDHVLVVGRRQQFWSPPTVSAGPGGFDSRRQLWPPLTASVTTGSFGSHRGLRQLRQPVVTAASVGAGGYGSFGSRRWLRQRGGEPGHVWLARVVRRETGAERRPPMAPRLGSAPPSVPAPPSALASVPAPPSALPPARSGPAAGAGVM